MVKPSYKNLFLKLSMHNATDFGIHLTSNNNKIYISNFRKYKTKINKRNKTVQNNTTQRQQQNNLRIFIFLLVDFCRRQFLKPIQKRTIRVDNIQILSKIGSFVHFGGVTLQFFDARDYRLLEKC